MLDALLHGSPMTDFKLCAHSTLPELRAARGSRAMAGLLRSRCS